MSLLLFNWSALDGILKNKTGEQINMNLVLSKSTLVHMVIIIIWSLCYIHIWALALAVIDKYSLLRYCYSLGCTRHSSTVNTFCLTLRSICWYILYTCTRVPTCSGVFKVKTMHTLAIDSMVFESWPAISFVHFH
jgi:hypothetical protein